MPTAAFGPPLPGLSQRGQFVATVQASQPLCRDHYRLTLVVPGFPPTRPGQFIQVACRDPGQADYLTNEISLPDTASWKISGRELSSPLALLRRPFSLAGRSDGPDGPQLQLIHRTVGVGTSWLAGVGRDDKLSIIGPLGNSFQPPDEGGVAVLVGGGVGIPPMIYLAASLAGKKAVAFCGAVDRDMLPLTVTADAPTPMADDYAPQYNIAEFAQYGVPAVIATDNGSYGFRGLVTQALERYLDQHLSKRFSAVVIYTCGPEPMMKRVAQIAGERGIKCQVSVERAMACGMGTCQSCVIKLRKPDAALPPMAGQDWAYKLACTDGPVFMGSDLLW